LFKFAFGVLALVAVAVALILLAIDTVAGVEVVVLEPEQYSPQLVCQVLLV
jgi:hypothetical protein